jgi:1-acyl-sn-glycerol-3-phosphate acyltransferase
MEQPEEIKMSRRVRLSQTILGFFCWLTLVLPYSRRTHGLEKINPRRNHLLVCNHVSLLDSILLGGLCWRSGCYPILVLADQKIWHASWLKKLISRSTSFLLERGKLNPRRIEELEAFGRSGKNFQLIVFPEGTRGDGVHVAECQPGIFYIAQAAQLPIVPVFFENMQFVSTKTGKLHLFGGLWKIETHFGEPIAPENYLSLSREEFTEFVRKKISGLRPPPPR